MELFVVVFKVFLLLVSGRIIHADKLRRKKEHLFLAIVILIAMVLVWTQLTAAFMT